MGSSARCNQDYPLLLPDLPVWLVQKKNLHVVLIPITKARASLLRRLAEPEEAKLHGIPA